MPQVGVDLSGGKFRDLLADLVAELLAGELLARHAHQRELFGEQVFVCEIVERGDQLAFGQIARGAKDDHNAWVPGTPGNRSVTGSSSLFCDLHFWSLSTQA